MAPGIDIYSLPLDTTEGFVLSCVDGSLNMEDISFMSGISVDRLARILDRLVELGAVCWLEPTRRSPKSGPQGALKGASESEPSVRRDSIPRPGRGGMSTPVRPTPRAETPFGGSREYSAREPVPGGGNAAASSRGAVPSRSPATTFGVNGQREEAGRTMSSRDPGPQGGPPSRLGAVYGAGTSATRSTPGDLYLSEDAIDLDPERKKKIYEAYSNLEGRNYYQLLGVEAKAGRHEIRTAYFDLSRTFHPDSVFGKRLGHYKHKMEIVFKHLTEAYDVLSRSQKRKEYDEYIASSVRTRHLTAALQTFGGVSGVLEADSGEKPTAPPPQEMPERGGASSAPPVVVVEKHEAIMPPPRARSDNPVPDGSVRSPQIPAERRIQMRDALRKKLDAATGRSPLAGSSPLPTMPPPSFYPPPEYRGSEPADDQDREERRFSAIRGLFRSLKVASEVSGSGSKIDQYLQQARQSEQSGDLLAAANLLRLALEIEPENEEIKTDHERISSALVQSLNREYEKRAKYEEKSGKWAAAAASWCKVSLGRLKDAEPARRAAEAFLKDGGDPRQAQQYAQKAVDLEPENASNFLLLARVFAAAGMKIRAKKALEAAAKLDPSNEMVKNLLQEVR